MSNIPIHTAQSHSTFFVPSLDLNSSDDSQAFLQEPQNFNNFAMIGSLVNCVCFKIDCHRNYPTINNRRIGHTIRSDLSSEESDSALFSLCI
jgi:hypothetical protein